MKNWAGLNYGFLAPPQSSNEPRPPGAVSQYSASFPVKYLGSGPVQHYTDYGGCLQIMNKLFLTHQSAKKRGLSRIGRNQSSEEECSELILTFTPKRLFVINKDTQILEEMCRLEAVYLVHPHPTRDSLFGLLTDNWRSGTLHCSVYLTTDKSKGSDVLYGFRKSCHFWLQLNHHLTTHQLTSKPGPSSAISHTSSGEYDRLATASSFTSDNQSPTDVLISLSDSQQELHNESSEMRSLELRRVSFAPTVHTEESSERIESKEASVVNGKTLRCKLMSNLCSLRKYVVGKRNVPAASKCALYPRLHPRDYPPPPPPSQASHSHTSQSAHPHRVDPPTCEDLIDLNSYVSPNTARPKQDIKTTKSCSLSLFHALSLDSIHRIERCFSAPSFLLCTEWYGNQTSSFTEAGNLEPLLSHNSTDRTSSEYLTSDPSPSEGSIASSISLEQFSSGTMPVLEQFSSDMGTGVSMPEQCSSREMGGDSSSLHRSIHQLIAASSCDVHSDWTSDLSPLPSVSVLSSTDSEESAQTSTDSASLGEETSNMSDKATLARLFEQKSSQVAHNDSIKQPSSAAVSSLFPDPSSNSHVDIKTALANLFKDLSIQTTSTGDRENNAGTFSEATLVKLFKEQGSQTSTATNRSCQSTPSSRTSSTTAKGVMSSEATLARLFRDQASQTTTNFSQSAQHCPVSTCSQASSSSSEATLAKLFKSNQSSAQAELSLPTLMSLAQSVLCTSFTVSASQVIDIPSLMETLRHVTSLLASSHAILDLSLCTLQEKLKSQPSNVCVCTCQGGQDAEKKLSQDSSTSGVVRGAKSEPAVLRP